MSRTRLLIALVLRLIKNNFFITKTSRTLKARKIRRDDINAVHHSHQDTEYADSHQISCYRLHSSRYLLEQMRLSRITRADTAPGRTDQPSVRVRSKHHNVGTASGICSLKR